MTQRQLTDNGLQLAEVVLFHPTGIGRAKRIVQQMIEATNKLKGLENQGFDRGAIFPHANRMGNSFGQLFRITT